MSVSICSNVEKSQFLNLSFLLQWFHKVCEQAATGNVAFSVKHLHANHLYCTGRHLEAAHVFSKLIETMPTGNHQREVSEGLARSLLKSGDFKNALEAAKQFVGENFT